MKKLITFFSLFVALVTTGNLSAQCCRTSAYGSASASNTCGTTVTITTCQYATERATLSNIVAGRTYKVNSSVTTDWVTIRSGSTACTAPVVYFGPQGGNWIATVNGTYYAHFSTNSSCGNQSSCRSTSITTVSGCAPATCTNTSSYGSATIDANGGAVTIATCSYAGEYSTISGAVSGQTLRFTSSVATDYITVRSGSATGPVVAQGTTPLQFNNTFTGTLYAHWNTNSSCGTQSACRTTSVQCMSCTPTAPDPCASITSLTCGTASNYSLTGSAGAWNNLGGPYTTPGDEQVFSFTPTLTGTYTVAVTASENYVDLYFKASSCSGSTGWTYVDDIFGSASNNVTLNAGTTYYFLLDDENTTATTGSVTITCPAPAPNPCNNVTNIASCGVSQNVNITGGDGVWSSFGGPYTTPGREQIFTFTPSVSASYPITVTNNGSGWIDLFVKTTSSGCNNSGWTYIDDISGTATNNVTLTAGVTYYFLLDDEDNSGSTGSISIGCPCIGNPVDGSYSYTGSPITINGNTTGACDNSALRAGDDLIYAFTVSCAGNYTFATCSGTNWDTYLYLTTAPGGGGTVLAYNDDYCGLQSSLTANLSAGTYYVVVEGFGSSSGAFTLNISGTGSTPSITGSVTNVSCNGGSNGSITATVNGNGNSATATLNGSAFNGSATGLSAGTYVISATNCWGTSTQSFTVTEPSVLTSASSSGSIACNGGTTTVSVSANGGTAPYTGTGNYTVGAGNYNYIVTDANGCTASTSITVTQPNLLTASSSSGNITCNGGSTTVTVSGNGGTTPYTGTGNFTVSAGNYNYSVSDANGCTASTSIVVTEPSPLTASITSNAPNATICSGGTAVLTASVAGGLGTVNYQWQYQSGSSWINVTGWSGTNVATPFVNSRNASPSNTRAYRIVVTSSTNNQCSVTASQLVTVIPDPVITITSTNISCFGANDGTASASISGGLPLNYGFNWYSNDNNSNNNNPAGDGTLNVTGLFPAQWVINTTVSGSSFGCYTEASVLITEPSALISSSSASAILCNGGSSTVSVSATGGTAPYTGTGSFTETAGDYSYTVTDANGCTSVTDITIYQPTPLKVTTTQGKIPCFGGTADIDVQAEGGTPPYTGAGTYNVSAGTYVYTVTDANGCSVSVTVTMPQPTQVVASSTYTPILCNGASSQVNVTGTGGTGTLTGVGDYEATAGTYTYVVTDENGCESSTTVTITEPSVLESSSSATSILCNGGTAVVSVAANGGTAPYTGTGTFTEVAGSYSYTVTDANGCQAITSITITEPTLLTASSSSSNFNGYGVSCNGGNNGSISVSATGGVAPYSSTGAYNNLSAGSYSYTVTDANGCTATTSNTITEPTLLTASSSSSNFNGYGVSCNGGNNGSISVSATGGVAPYSSTGAYNNLSAGSYSYTVTDANGCAATTSNTITEPTLLTASSSSGSIACNGGTTAVIVSADGGTTPYVGTGSFTVVAGSYNYTVTDANGCQAATSISISQPTAVIVSAGNDATVYFGYAPSACTTLNASANGGTGSLTYTWNNGTNGSSNTVCPSSSTSYTVTATDANGCQASDAVNVCVINVVCYAGGSNVAKVEVCHNGNSICISPTSVASHLAHGDALGSCVEVNACNTVTQAVRLSDDHSKEIFISLFPNPATNNVTVLYEGADELSVVEFVVYNALGEQIINGQLKHGETDINISLLTPGVYFLKTSDLNAKPIRFIKE